MKFNSADEILCNLLATFVCLNLYQVLATAFITIHFSSGSYMKYVALQTLFNVDNEIRLILPQLAYLHKV